MLVAPFKVLLDANALYPFTLRDTLLRAAAAGLYQPYWSDVILDEVERNLVGAGVMTLEQAARLRSAMAGAFPEAEVAGFDALIDAMRNQDKDRHVAAAAVRAGARVIVTANLKDFNDLPRGLEAQSPDQFLCNLYDVDPGGMVEIVRVQAEALRRPPRSVADVLRGLSKVVPAFAQCVSAAMLG